MMRTVAGIAAGSLAALLVAHAAPEAETVVEAGSAFISHDVSSRTWTIGSAGASLTLALDPTTDFQILRLASASDRSWTAGSAPDSVVKVGGQTLPFGSREAGFNYRDVSTTVDGSAVQLDATFDLAKQNLRITRHFAATSDTPTFEAWTTFAPLSGVPAVSDLDGVRLTVPPGTMHWVNGLTSADPNPQRDSAFAMRQQDLRVGESLSFGAKGRSSEDTVPWLTIDGPDEEFYAGLMWSGAWTMNASRSSAGLGLTLRLATMTTKMQASVDGPHAVFGVVPGGASAAAAALRTFIVQRVRNGRPFQPLVTYNTWFAHGVEIDEQSMRHEIDGAAALGAELFVLDAGWYIDAGRGGPSDFSSGLGTWQVDSTRFPSGLRSLGEYAHSRGLKFGIWVEPERVALSTLNRSGLAQESWIAKAAGKYGSTVSGLICLGTPAARQWVLDQVVRLIDQVGPDYLKWDNNMWINCDRAGHVHNGTDGNFAHVNGLYEILGELRSRYPDLLIENVSGGGNRLDLAMLRYSDVGWMDDRSAPSALVRRNVEGLSAVFPPAYLLSFAMNGPDEPLHDAPDLRLYFRSRMLGVLGLCYRIDDFDEGDIAVMRHQINLYKVLRGTLSNGTHTLLTPQAAVSDGPAWDALQTTASSDRPVTLWAFQSDPSATQFTVKPTGLQDDIIYDVISADRGRLGSVRGADLMSKGIRVLGSQVSDAHVLTLRPLSQ